MCGCWSVIQGWGVLKRICCAEKEACIVQRTECASQILLGFFFSAMLLSPRTSGSWLRAYTHLNFITGIFKFLLMRLSESQNSFQLSIFLVTEKSWWKNVWEMQAWLETFLGLSSMCCLHRTTCRSLLSLANTDYSCFIQLVCALSCFPVTTTGFRLSETRKGWLAGYDVYRETQIPTQDVRPNVLSWASSFQNV